MRSDGGADAVAVDLDDLGERHERQRERIGRGFRRGPGMADRCADRVILGEDAGDHRVDRLPDRVAGADGVGLAIGELENGPVGPNNSRVARGRDCGLGVVRGA
jgi:hypothetical protein